MPVAGRAAATPADAGWHRQNTTVPGPAATAPKPPAAASGPGARCSASATAGAAPRSRENAAVRGRDRPPAGRPATPTAATTREQRPVRGAGYAGGTPQRHRASSVELPQIHALIKRSHLLTVAIEHQSWLAFAAEQAARADKTLAGLAPAWMIDGRVDVGIKPVLMGRQQIPGGGRLLLRQ